MKNSTYDSNTIWTGKDTSFMTRPEKMKIDSWCFIARQICDLLDIRDNGTIEDHLAVHKKYENIGAAIIECFLRAAYFPSFVSDVSFEFFGTINGDRIDLAFEYWSGGESTRGVVQVPMQWIDQFDRFVIGDKVNQHVASLKADKAAREAKKIQDAQDKKRAADLETLARLKQEYPDA